MQANKANAADCPSCVFIEGALPVMVSQIGVNCAGEVGISSAGCIVQCLVGWHRLFVQPLIGGVSCLLRLNNISFDVPFSDIFLPH